MLLCYSLGGRLRLGACDFESGLCGWRHLATNDFEWRRQTGSTPTDFTGPSTDHTHPSSLPGVSYSQPQLLAFRSYIKLSLVATASAELKTGPIVTPLFFVYDFRRSQLQKTSANYDQLGQLIMSPAGPEH
jgi:hypothetical protein